jgi:ECF transporter S component (folate family)
MFKSNLKKLILAGIFIALAIIFTRLFSVQLGKILRIGLGHLPILLAGILLGPFWGAAVGALSDVVGFMVSPLGGFFIPGITISAALWGFIPGIIVQYTFKRKKMWAILASCIVCGVLIDIILTPLWLSLAYGSLTYKAMLPVRSINAFVMMFVNSILSITLVKALEKGKIVPVELD